MQFSNCLKRQTITLTQFWGPTSFRTKINFCSTCNAVKGEISDSNAWVICSLVPVHDVYFFTEPVCHKLTVFHRHNSVCTVRYVLWLHVHVFELSYTLELFSTSKTCSFILFPWNWVCSRRNGRGTFLLKIEVRDINYFCKRRKKEMETKTINR